MPRLNGTTRWGQRSKSAAGVPSDRRNITTGWSRNVRATNCEPGTSSLQARVVTLGLSPRELEEALHDGTVDAAVGYYPDLTSPAIKQCPLYNHDLTCLVRSGHPIATWVFWLIVTTDSGIVTGQSGIVTTDSDDRDRFVDGRWDQARV